MKMDFVIVGGLSWKVKCSDNEMVTMAGIGYNVLCNYPANKATRDDTRICLSRSRYEH